MRALLLAAVALCGTAPLTRDPYVQRVKARTGPAHPGIQWVELTGLKAGTEYRYRVVSRGKPLSPWYAFRTARATGS